MPGFERRALPVIGLVMQYSRAELLKVEEDAAVFLPAAVIHDSHGENHPQFFHQCCEPIVGLIGGDQYLNGHIRILLFAFFRSRIQCKNENRMNER